MSPRLATFLVFSINGAMIGTWVAHIPWLQDHLGISKATLGLCLLCMAAGALVSMPLTGHLIDRHPSATVTRSTTLVFCLMPALPLLATSPYMLGAILFVFGASNGAMDVAMNAHGVSIQKELDRPIMSSLHGGWSVGGFAAAGLVAVAAAAGLDPRVESLIVYRGVVQLHGREIPEDAERLDALVGGAGPEHLDSFQILERLEGGEALVGEAGVIQIQLPQVGEPANLRQRRVRYVSAG